MLGLYRILLVLSFIVPIFSFGAAEEVKKEMNVVVGSFRGPDRLAIHHSRIYGQHIEDPEIDLTHTKTFGGKAWTIDLQPCALPKRKALHFPEDITKWTPPPPYKLGDVFMELFPSSWQKYKETKLKNEEESNPLYMAQAIYNIALNMTEGRTLTIEHIPLFSVTSNDEEYLKLRKLVEKENPFHGMLHIYYSMILVYISTEEELQPIVNREANEFRELLQHDYPIMLEARERVKRSYPVEYLTEYERCLQGEASKHLYKTKEFLAEAGDSLSLVILGEFIMLKQKDAIARFLSQWFTDINIRKLEGEERNPFNGRKNCWLISGVRTGSPVVPETL